MRKQISFTTPPRADVAGTELLVLRFAAWSRSGNSRGLGIAPGALGRLYAQALTRSTLDALRASGIEPPRDDSGAPAPARLEPLRDDDALRVSRAWSRLPRSLAAVLVEHYLLPRANLAASARRLGIPPGRWCADRDLALRLLAVEYARNDAPPTRLRVERVSAEAYD